MPVHRYARGNPPPLLPPADRAWSERVIERAPLWSSVDLRDGNQALANPMDLRRKRLMFDLLAGMGFKDIEIGYPSASEAEFDFVRDLIDHDRIPDDITVSVFTPVRDDLIDRTFEAIEGADRAVVHLCHATACLWREVVFGMTREEVRRLAVSGARRMVRLADRMPQTEIRFEYSPETFNITEPDFALEIVNTVAETVDANPGRPLIVNLPTTVETHTPNVFADQVEWMHRNLERREAIILSVHPHNDRGTAVASAELALMAGADRVEGTLFGNGERTGNVCLATLALNLFSRGVDPQLDFSDIGRIRATVEECNEMPVHARHPYAGDLVFTAFSGTHQDAVAKGLAALAERASATGRNTSELDWEVPYLPIDPADVGRDYQAIIRVNSQSGKGGIAHVLRAGWGLDLPRALRMEFAKAVQRVTEETGSELPADRVWELFRDEYCAHGCVVRDRAPAGPPGAEDLAVTVTAPGADPMELSGTGPRLLTALTEALAARGIAAEFRQALTTDRTVPSAAPKAGYVELAVGAEVFHGVGLARTGSAATLEAALSALRRAGALPRARRAPAGVGPLRKAVG